jgi:hypothetical protein
MLRLASLQRSIVWCQIGLFSLPTPAYVHNGSFDISAGQETETLEKPSSHSLGKVVQVTIYT